MDGTTPEKKSDKDEAVSQTCEIYIYKEREPQTQLEIETEGTQNGAAY